MKLSIIIEKSKTGVLLIKGAHCTSSREKLGFRSFINWNYRNSKTLFTLFFFKENFKDCQRLYTIDISMIDQSMKKEILYLLRFLAPIFSLLYNEK